MKVKICDILKWFLTILFVGYIGGITLFTHSHIVDKTTFIHSHPFQKSDHAHTKEQLVLLHQFFHTAITSSVVPEFNFSINSTPKVIFFPKYRQFSLTPKADNSRSPRAPPVAA